MAKSENPYVVLGFSVLVALAVGSGIFLWRCDPKGRKVWGPRLTLLQLVLLVTLVAVPMIYWGRWLALLLVLGFVALLAYSVVFKTRVCEECGKTAQPVNVIRAAQFCPSCGEKLSPSQLQRRLGG
jgi:hypothetical protein